MGLSAFKFEETKPVILNDELLADLRAVAASLGAEVLPQKKYRECGRYSTTAIKNRFGTWNAAVVAAGLGKASLRDIPSADLFENLRDVWTRLGRQPRKREMAKPFSRYTRHPYIERYGGWVNSIRAFLVFAAADEQYVIAAGEITAASGPRDPSLRLRFLVMRRDRFTCRHCGKSPSMHPSLELHVDHVVAWSKGGRTEAENLQTLCSTCNLGKSDLDEHDAAG